MKKTTLICLTGIFCGGLIAAEPPAGEEAASEKETPVAEEVSLDEAWQSLPHGVRFRTIHEGDGTKAALWASVYVHYRLIAENGTVLEDTYRDKEHGGRAHKHVIGSGTMAEALEMAVSTMRERDRRVFMIPADLFDLYDFHGHDEDEEHDEDDHDKVAAALKPGSTVRAEVSLLWVRPYDPANFNRFRFPGEGSGGQD